MAMDKWVALGIISKAFGMRCMNAFPKRAPTAKLTRRKIYFLRSCSLSERVKTPSKDTKLTIITLTNAYREIENIYINYSIVLPMRAAGPAAGSTLAARELSLRSF